MNGLLVYTRNSQHQLTHKLKYNIMLIYIIPIDQDNEIFKVSFSKNL